MLITICLSYLNCPPKDDANAASRTLIGLAHASSATDRPSLY
jgi:hypothetical protein